MNLNFLFVCTALAIPVTSGFSGVDCNGNVSLTLPLGNIQIGEDKTLPLELKFISSFSHSDVLTGGWSLPFLDSHCVQESPDAIRVLLPDGTEEVFAKRGNTIIPSSPWISIEQTDNTLVLTSDEELVSFRDGRIETFKHPEGKLSWFRNSEGLLERIERVGMNPLSVEIFNSGPDRNLRIAGLETGVLTIYSQSVHQGSVEYLENSGFLAEGLRSVAVGGNEIYSVSSAKEGEEVVLVIGDKQLERTFDYRYRAGNGEATMLPSGPVKIFRPGTELMQVGVYSSESKQTIQPAVIEEGGRRRVIDFSGNEFVEYYLGKRVRKVEERTSVSSGTKEIYRASFNEDGLIIRDSNGEYSRRLVNGVYQVFKGGEKIREYPSSR